MIGVPPSMRVFKLRIVGSIKPRFRLNPSFLTNWGS
jgi:hypothetical protein